MLENFRHETLVESDQIRVIDIYPNLHTTNNLISCCMRSVRLSDNPHYEALSYCWGDSTLNKGIICNGKRLWITTNLYEALCRLQDRHGTRTIWADAVCINQSNIKERNHQVRLMRQIYEAATHVNVWLGEHDDESRRGIALISAIGKAENKLVSLDFDELRYTTFLHQNGLPERSDKSWKALFTLFKRPWFARSWIVQEVAVAVSVRFQCGDDIVALDDIMSALGLSYMLSEKTESTNCLHFVQVASTRQDVQRGTHLSMLSLVQRHRITLATDPRDKIFAFIGIASDGSGNALCTQPDYHRLYPEVYWDFTVQMLEQERNLDILSIPSGFRAKCLPTWVPDFSRPAKTRSFLG